MRKRKIDFMLETEELYKDGSLGISLKSGKRREVSQGWLRV
jgi:hypothetical protein